MPPLRRMRWAGSIGRFFIADQGVPGTGLADSNIHFGDALTL